MPHYQRLYISGGTYFFTLVTNCRKPIFLNPFARDALHEAIITSKNKAGQFQIDAMCLLPDHLHCIWTLPTNDSDYSTRWKVIKTNFSRLYRQLGGTANEVSASKERKGEVGIWQRRFWEHLIRDQEDMNRHVEYIHFNPVKHGYVQSVKDWPWSSFHQYVKDGIYDENWGTQYYEPGDYADIE